MCMCVSHACVQAELVIFILPDEIVCKNMRCYLLSPLFIT